MLKLISQSPISKQWRRSLVLANMGKYNGVSKYFMNQEGSRRFLGTMGITRLRDPSLNKGLAFTLAERQALRLHGLQPICYRPMKEQLEICWLSISHYSNDLHKYLYAMELQDLNEKLFFRLLSEYIEHLLPIVYTPTVGLACLEFGLIYRRPRGLFITINDIGHCYEVLKNWPYRHVRAICVTDGERVLGLGDLGACGMGIPVGKLSLYTALGGIKPYYCLPITLDVGTNNQALLEDPLYVGLRQQRVKGEVYDKFVDEFMEAVVKRFGQTTLIHFEDFANQNAARFLERYRQHYCTFNDDIQGTAATVLAGLLACARLTGSKISANKLVFFGAGTASVGVADLIVKAMVNEGLKEKEAADRIYMFNIKGLVVKGSQVEDNLGVYAKDHAPTKSLIGVIKEIKPTVLIGASTATGAFSPEVLQTMASINKRPIVFALSNPTSKSECTAEEAYQHTEGRVIFASGSPFGDVKYGGKVYKPGQANNAYIFPGIALGIIVSGIHYVSDDLFILAARTVADMVSKDILDQGGLFPPVTAIKECSVMIAAKMYEYAARHGISTVYPEPIDKLAYVKSELYNLDYEPSLTKTWPYPETPPIKTRPFMPIKRYL